MKKLLLILIALLQLNFVLAQTFPVRVTSQAIPPYPTNLSGYANSGIVNSPLRVQLVLSDVTASSREIRLAVSIEGNGINATSAPVVIGAPTLILDGGIPLNLTITELAPYFEQQNLQGISSVQYNSPLPDGSYRFCFEVFDAFTGNRLSSKNCASIFLINNDPPFLNKPDNEAKISEQNPTNIIFQWTPRHINVPNVSYEFSIVEVWDPYIDPQAIFVASPPLYQEVTTNTSLLYGPIQPLLLAGKRYAWRVRAFATNNGEEVSVFNNNGNSEIFWFDYQASCELPTNIQVQDVSMTNATISWIGHPDHLDYTIKYREAGSNRWYSKTTPRDYVTIDEFKADTVYEYRVIGNCTQNSFGESPVDTFRTLSEELAEYASCGIQPDPVDLSNQELLTELFVNDVFTAGDFPVYVKEVSGATSFTGEGYISTPWLATVRIPVKFQNIKINTDMKLVDGFVITTYDPNWGSIIDGDAVVDVILGDDGDIQVIDVDVDIVDVQIDENGDIIIISTDGPIPDTFDGGNDIIFVDSTGEEWRVDADGDISQGEQAEGGPATSGNTDGVNNSGVNEITASDVTVTFNNTKGYYSFDTVPENAGGSIANQYDKVPISGGGEYYIPYKAIAALPNRPTDFLTAEVSFGTSDYSASDIIFKTKEGTKVQANWDSDSTTATLSLKKAFDFAKQQIIATVRPKDSTDKYTVAGTANLWHLANQDVATINVKLISVNGASLSGIGERINEIYNPAGVRFNVTSASPLSVSDTTLDVGDSSLLSQYTKGEKAWISQFKTLPGYQRDTYYLFVTDIPPSDSGTEGFMPLKRQFGFVFAGDDKGRTAAHELGHGVFGLEHPFKKYNTTGITNLLMDYGTGVRLSHMDWEKMHAPGIQIYWFQGDEDGEYASYQYLVGYNVVPELFSSHLENFSGSSISFVSPTGKIISIPSTAKDVTFINKGSLFAFTITKNGKEERYVGAKRVKNGESKFAGYLKETGNKNNWNERVYQDILSRDLSQQVTVYLGKLKKTSESCGIDIYSKAHPNNAHPTEWNSGGNDDLIVNTEYTNGLSPIGPTINSPEACDLCSEGEKFYSLHADINDENIREIVLKVSKLICDPNVDTTFFEEFSKNGYKNLLDWQKQFYSEGMWPNDYEAYKAFYDSYNRYIEYYLEAKTIVQTSTDKEALLRVAYNLSLNQLETLSAVEKLSMLKIMTKGFVGGYWFGLNYNIEALALKVIKSVNNDRGETDQSRLFLEGLLSENYKVGDKYLYENLFKKLDDYFGKDNFSELILRFTKLSLETYSENPSKITLEWGARNESFILNYVVSDNDYEFDFEGKQVFVTGECLQKRYTVSRNGESVENGCNEYLYDNYPLHPFNDFVTLTILESTNILPSFMCGNPNVQWCGKAIKVPAVFLPYLQEKKSTQSFENWGINTIVIAGTVLSFGEVAAARATGQIAYWAIADLTYTFSNDAVRVLYDNFDDKTDNEEFKDYLKSGWDGIGYIFLAKSAADVTGLTAAATKKQLARGYAAIKTYGEDEFFDVFEQSLREASAELAEEQIKAMSNDLRKTVNQLENEIPDLIQEELEFSRKLYSGTGNFKDLLKNNILEKLGDNQKYADLKNWINNLEDGNLLNKLETISGKVDENGISDISRLGDDFKDLTGIGIDFNDIELLSAWGALSKSPVIRAKPDNLRILKQVHSRFEYGGKSSFEGINSLLNEGSQASRQKIINGLKEVDEIFDSSLPVKFSGIKKGDVKVTIVDANGKGQEVARIIDKTLEKKKFIENGDVVGKYDGDDILRNGDEIGFKLANSAENLSFAEKSKLFVKNENALLTYNRNDGTFFMQKSPSNQDLSTGYPDELTFSFKYNSGPNANSKDVFGKIAMTEDGFLVGNIKKPTKMNNEKIKGITEDAFDMALFHFGKSDVNGLKALWVRNANLYPDLPDNKSINLIKFEEALETMEESKAVFETVTGRYSKSRDFSKVKEIKKLTEAEDGVYGYEVIFTKQ
ncbi:fibronectin type III domain-containing protein [Aquimarina litoralis]|uniref:fibronectin type III domain-containing protein n=1 Tax=Aquimarina litoralis TaxID=584605 RepID=UPI001C599B6C|nr:fibronectin type III domain-containing protein [Aquimarina litoralis]MBW1295822.1 hypothetical protein [Aquimarina litoralis]